MAHGSKLRGEWGVNQGLCDLAGQVLTLRVKRQMGTSAVHNNSTEFVVPRLTWDPVGDFSTEIENLVFVIMC